ncbi:MAG: methyltransferase [Brevundimonas sp. 32-68-21]|nr:MAG: methyltransferase [Brevundimonas sp. 32-68-21]
MAPAAPDVVENALLDGRVRLRQPARGYRAGMDAALLAAAVAPRSGDRLFEAGCGAGAVLMQIAARHAGVSLTGLERDSVAAGLARENADLNQSADRIRIFDGDVADGFRPLDLPPFDWAVSNPPFFDDPGALRAPAPGKQGAWMADDGLSAWTGLLLKAVREGGRIVIIHRADRLADLLTLLGEKAGSFAIRPVQFPRLRGKCQVVARSDTPDDGGSHLLDETSLSVAGSASPIDATPLPQAGEGL